MYGLTNIIGSKDLMLFFQIYNPDFICLQEVTKEFLHFLYSHKFIQENYYLSENFKRGYDVLILSKYFTKFSLKEFPPNMRRKLLIGEYLFNGKETIYLATSHFESLNSAKTRQEQLKITFQILNENKLNFLMGDFNLDSSWEIEEKNIDKSYKDSWILHCEKYNINQTEGLTMPKDSQFPEWRPDRILFRNDDSKLKMENFEIIEKNEIELNMKHSHLDVKTPSDHYR